VLANQTSLDCHYFSRNSYPSEIASVLDKRAADKRAYMLNTRHADDKAGGAFIQDDLPLAAVGITDRIILPT
jgi:hypothetical protein